MLLRRVGYTAFVLCIFALAYFALGTSKTRMAATLIVVALPLLVYLSLFRPIIFPLSAYVLLVPFENLFATDKYGSISKLVALFAAAVLTFWLIRTRRVVRPPGPALAAWGVFLLWMALSVFWALEPTDAVKYMVTCVELVALFAIVSVTPANRADLNGLLAAVVAGGTIAAAYGVYVFRNGSEVGGRLLIQYGESKIDPNAFATALLLPIALVVMAALNRRWSLQKLGFIAIVLVLMGGMFAAASRGALLGLGAMLVFFMLRTRHRGQLLAVSIAGLLVSFLLPHSPWQRFSDALSHGGSGRLQIWLVGLHAFKEHWLLGAGAGMFQYAYDQSLIKVYQSVFAQWHKVAHNTPLSVLVELGTVGFVMFCVAWYRQWNIFKDTRANDGLRDLKVTLQAAMLGITVSSIFLSVLTAKFLWLLFMVMAVVRSVSISWDAQALLTPSSQLPEPGWPKGSVAVESVR